MENQISKDIDELHSHLDRMKELYRENHIDEAGNKVKNIFAIITNSLLREAGLPTNQKAVEKIEALYHNKWLTDDENNHLHKLRKIRNLFVHDDDTEMGDDAEKQQMLAEYTNNFQKCISYCQKDIEWFEKKIYDVNLGNRVENSWYAAPPRRQSPISAGAYNSRPNYSSPRPYNNTWHGDYYNRAPYRQQTTAKAPKDKSLIVLFPIALATIISLMFIFFFRQTNLDKIAEKYGDDTYSKQAVTILLVTAAVILVGGIFLYELLPQISAGIVMGVLAYHITGSDLCTVLVVITTVLLITRYSRTLRYVFFWMIYAFLLLVIVFISKQFLSHFFCPEGSDREDTLLKVILPIGLYILVFFLGHFMVLHHLHPFKRTLGNNRMPLNTPLSLVLTAASGYLIYGGYKDNFSTLSDNSAKNLFVSKITMLIGFAIMMYLIYLICSLIESKNE